MIIQDSLIQEFFNKVAANTIEIYNEFSLQHEFGIFLRQNVPDGWKVQFERPTSHFNIGSKLIKTEIDLSIFKNSRLDREAIEFKFPRAGRTPESMFDTCKDIQFLEELTHCGFVGGFVVLVADNSDFYQPKREQGGIYPYFRSGKSITGQIKKPTGSKSEFVNINGRYTIRWHDVQRGMKYAAIQVT